MPQTSSTKANRPKQLRIPGTVPKAIAAIEDLFDAALHVKERFTKARTALVEAYDLLKKAMKKHKREWYSKDGHMAQILRDEKVKVKRIKGEDDEE